MRHVVFMSALLGLSFIQCSSKSNNNGPKYPDAAAFCVAWAQAECSTAVVNSCLVSSQDVCSKQRQAVCTSTYITPALAQSLTYDAAQAETCVNAISTAYSNTQITGDEEQSIAAGCNAVFSKMGTTGMSCTSDSDCKRSESFQCVIHVAIQPGTDAGEPAGTCQKPEAQGGGNPCSAPNATCVTDYHCSSDAYCLKDEPLGNKCSAVDPCQTGLLCTAGTCVNKFAIGAACTSDDDCLSGVCNEDYNLCADHLDLTPSEPFCANMRQ